MFLVMALPEHLSESLGWPILQHLLQGTACFHRLVRAGRSIFALSRCW